MTGERREGGKEVRSDCKERSASSQVYSQEKKVTPARYSANEAQSPGT